MTDNNHPITPPPKLVQQWDNDWHRSKIKYDSLSTFVATQAARWGAEQQLKLDIEQVNQAWQRGADHELEACCEWITIDQGSALYGEQLREYRRPKSLSLKELNLKHLEVMERDGHYLPEIISDLRRAIKSLPS